MRLTTSGRTGTRNGAIRMVAVMATGAMLVAAAACGSSEPAAQPTMSAPPTTQAAIPTLEQLHRLVTPPGPDHPAKGKVFEVTFQEAATGGLLEPPQGMTFSPDACVNFIDMGDPTSLNGWLQYNEASPVGKQHNLAHKDFFVGTVFALPGGANIDKLRQAALTCGAGNVSLAGEGGTKITGSLTNTEVEPLDLSGATTFEMTQRLEFKPTEDATTNAVLKQYYGDLDPGGGVLRLKQIVIVGVGPVLFLVNMQDRQAARQLAQDFHRRAVEAGIK